MSGDRVVRLDDHSKKGRTGKQFPPYTKGHGAAHKLVSDASWLHLETPRKIRFLDFTPNHENSGQHLLEYCKRQLVDIKKLQTWSNRDLALRARSVEVGVASAPDRTVKWAPFRRPSHLDLCATLSGSVD
jgi:hypothetical protein